MKWIVKQLNSFTNSNEISTIFIEGLGFIAICLMFIVIAIIIMCF